MRRLLALVAAVPFTTGCVVVNRYSVIDPSAFSSPITDGSLTGCLHAIAGCSGAVGGIIVWLVTRSRQHKAL